MSMRHMEEELRHSNELNTVQQAELKTLRQRQSETRALVGVQSAEDERAEKASDVAEGIGESDSAREECDRRDGVDKRHERTRRAKH